MDDKLLSSASSSQAGYQLTDSTPPLPKRSPSSNPLSQETYELSDYIIKDSDIPESHGRSWRRRLDKLLDSHSKVRKVWLYFRGPRPKVNLPGASMPLSMPITCLSQANFSWHRPHALLEPYALYGAPCSHGSARAYPHTSNPPLHLAVAIRASSCRIHHRTSILFSGTVIPDTPRFFH